MERHLRTHSFITAVVLSLVAFATPLRADVTLAAHSAEYKVKISGLSGVLTTELTATEHGYEAVHAIRPTGFARILARGEIVERSSFAPAEDGILPQHYVSSDTLSRDETEAELAFDWSTRRVTGTVNAALVDVMLEDVAHDRVSLQYELMLDLLNGGAGERYLLYDIDELKTLNVSLAGSREVRVPAGRYNAIGIRHQAEGSSRITTLWCVEELGFLPVMIEQHRKGKLRMRASLERYTPAES